LKVILAIVALFVLIAASLSMCAYKLYNTFDDFPEQAKVQNLNKRYAHLVADLNASIDKSDSAYSLANELENISYPTETLYVEMQKQNSKNKDDSGLTILDRREAGSASKFRVVINGGGYGRSNNLHFWILQHPLNKYEYEHIEILFERQAPSSEYLSDRNTDTE